MEIPSMQDFNDFKKSVNSKLEEIKELLVNSNPQVSKKLILTVKEVTEEFHQSPHVQRVARGNGSLSFISGTKEITYQRSHVEDWIQNRTVS